MNACIQSDGSTSESFKVRSFVKQGCVLAPTLFAIQFAALLQHTFDGNEDGIYPRTRVDGSVFNLKRLKSKRLTTEVLIRKLLFADAAAIVIHSVNELQRVVGRLAETCDLFGLKSASRKLR